LNTSQVGKNMAFILFKKKCEKGGKNIFQVREKRGFISWLGEFQEWYLNASLISCRFTFVSAIVLDIQLYHTDVSLYICPLL
jgi:hypothetical protein